MNKQARKYGTAVSVITNPSTGQVEALVYRWNNGDETHHLTASLPGGTELGSNPVDEEDKATRP